MLQSGERRGSRREGGRGGTVGGVGAGPALGLGSPGRLSRPRLVSRFPGSQAPVVWNRQAAGGSQRPLRSHVRPGRCCSSQKMRSESRGERSGSGRAGVREKEEREGGEELGVLASIIGTPVI